LFDYLKNFKDILNAMSNKTKRVIGFEVFGAPLEAFDLCIEKANMTASDLGRSAFLKGLDAAIQEAIDKQHRLQEVLEKAKKAFGSDGSGAYSK
jgi:hypothetical protein